MGTRHTKGSQNTPRNNVESHWIPAGFCFFVFFFPPFVRPHASNKILSTGERKRVQSDGVGTGALDRGLDEERQAAQPQGHTQV